MASVLAAGGHAVSIWEYDPAARAALADRTARDDFLQGFTLPPEIMVVDTLEDLAGSADLLVLATPAQFLRGTLQTIPPELRGVDGIINLAKGIENRTQARMSEVIADTLTVTAERVVTVSGPSHAEEVVRAMPTTVVAAGPDGRLVERVQTSLSTSFFRVYHSSDLVGVELGGALKNVIALAVGIADGLGMGDNSKGALITRGLAEITRLGVAMGARAETFAGLSGLGDLVTTCYSRHSRNRAVGERVGRGETLETVLKSIKQVAEGVTTTSSAVALARQTNVEMPITLQVYRILFEGQTPRDGVGELMERTLKAEVWN
jgi:glycerol-3-phosphate dehydrogenase (NAD(P)+)